MDSVQAHIFYEGTVQGVGFRYTVRQSAESLGLTGWVRNLSDGRVEILVEGEKNTIESLCASIGEWFDGYIRGKTIKFKKINSEFKDFCIIY